MAEVSESREVSRPCMDLLQERRLRVQQSPWLEHADNLRDDLFRVEHMLEHGLDD